MNQLPGEALVSSACERLRGDCADALRLELDCPQQSLSRPQREQLARLSALLDDARATPADLEQAVHDAWRAIA